MSSTATPFLGLTMPTPGQMANTWGTAINTNFSKLDTQASTDNTAITANTSNIAANTSAITTLQASDGVQTGQISALRDQMTAANSNIAANTSAIATLQNSVVSLQSQINAAVGASPAGPSNNITTNAGNIGTLEGQMTTANNNIAANSSAINSVQTLAQSIMGYASWSDYKVNSGTMQGNWIIFRFAPRPSNVNAVEIAFGYGTGQETDTIVLPQTGGASWNWYAMASLQNAPQPQAMYNLEIILSGLQLTFCRVIGSSPNTTYARGWVTAYWQAIAYRGTP